MDTSDDRLVLCRNNLCIEKGLKLCTQCRAAWYCSKECQEDHWRRHKKFCKAISSSPEMLLRYFKAVDGYKISENQRESCEFDQALLSLQESLELHKEFQNDLLISLCYYEIGRLPRSKKQREEALVNFRKALEISREIHGENHGQTSCKGDYNESLISLQKAKAIFSRELGVEDPRTVQTDVHIDLCQQFTTYTKCTLLLKP